MQKYDLIVIGGGSGLDVATSAAQRGLKVAIIERDRLGGTCLNKGCIPSKLLIHSADVLETIKQAAKFGIVIPEYRIEFRKIVQRVKSFTDHESDEIRNALADINNPKLFSKECKFIGPKMIRLFDKSNDNHGNSDNEADIMTGDKILIAAGSRPRIPPIIGLEKTDYLTSDQALRLEQQPSTLTIVGGGYVACEMAHFFGTLGTKINIVQLNDVLLPNEDEDISQNFTKVFSKKYNVYLGYKTEKVSEFDDDNTHKKFYIQAQKNSESLELTSDQLLVAAGRIPNSDTLNLDKTGVEVDEKGNIKTNMYLETNIDGIFALGDVVGRYLFKHSANHEAKFAYNNIIHHDKIPVDYTAMPHAIFTSPQIAGVGFTEQELRNQNQISYVKSIYPFINTAMGKAIEDQDGFVKFLIDKESKKILGCHIIGSCASILIHEVLVAMMSDNGNGNIDRIMETIHVHPALSEVVARAAAEF
jgi:dihydrolipoamide dehydrogenase